MSTARALRAEALLRAIVGIDDAHIAVATSGEFARVLVVPTPGSSHRQAMRNAGSALLAGLGVRVATELVGIGSAEELATLRAAAALASVETAVRRSEQSAAESARANFSVAANGDIAGGRDGADQARTHDRATAALRLGSAPNTNGTGARAAPPPTRPAVDDALAANGTQRPAEPNGAASRSRPRIDPGELRAMPPTGSQGAEAVAFASDRPIAGSQPAPTGPLAPEVHSVELRRIHDKVRCHVTVIACGRRFAGAGEAGAESTTGMLNLVARVTTEAVRASIAAASAIQYDGASVVEIGERAHVLVAMHQRRHDTVHAMAGAAPVNGRIEEAAARAALAALRELL